MNIYDKLLVIFYALIISIIVCGTPVYLSATTVEGGTVNKLSVGQRKHTKRVGMLIGFAYRQGYEFTQGDANRDSRVFGE